MQKCPECNSNLLPIDVIDDIDIDNVSYLYCSDCDSEYVETEDGEIISIEDLHNLGI